MLQDAAGEARLPDQTVADSFVTRSEPPLEQVSHGELVSGRGGHDPPPVPLLLQLPGNVVEEGGRESEPQLDVFVRMSVAMEVNQEDPGVSGLLDLPLERCPDPGVEGVVDQLSLLAPPLDGHLGQRPVGRVDSFLPDQQLAETGFSQFF